MLYCSPTFLIKNDYNESESESESERLCTNLYFLGGLFPHIIYILHLLQSGLINKLINEMENGIEGEIEIGKLGFFLDEFGIFFKFFLLCWCVFRR